MIDEKVNLPPLPRGWVWTTLSQISKELRAGGTPLSTVKEYYENGTIPFVKIEDMVNSGKYLLDAKTKITYEGLKNSSAWLVPCDSLLYSMYASYGEATINKVEVATNQAIIAYVPPKNLMTLDYVYYYLKSIKHTLKTRGTTQKNLNAQIVEKIPVPLAPLGEQKRIVARLEELFTRLDAGVEGLRKVKAQLKRYRQAVLKYAFEGKLTEEWRKTYKNQIEPTTKLLEHIKQERKKDPKYKEPPSIDESDLPKIPENWVWTTVGSLFDVGSGGTPSRRKPEYWAGNIPWVSSGEVAFCEIWSTNEYITKEGLENSSAKLYPEGTVLMALYGEGKTRGQAAILRIAATTNQAIACIRCTNSPMPPEYVYWWLYYRYYETRRIREGANQPNMYLHHVRKMTIPVASLLEQKEIIQKIEESLSVADEIDRAVDTSLLQAGRLRQCILKTAFEGKLVPQDPSDEPAEKLLERIRAERLKSKGEKDINKKKSKPKQLELSAYVK
jgi:type I restriction enzyme S subunit